MNMLFLKILTFSIMDHSLSMNSLIKIFLNFISTLRSHNFPNALLHFLHLALIYPMIHIAFKLSTHMNS